MTHLDEAEARAEQVLAGVPGWIWDGETLPVPVEDIADSCFGLLVRDMENMGEAPGAPPPEPSRPLSGLLLSGRGEVWVNAAEAREWPARRRFTIGHELGHWVLHREGRDAVFCRPSSLDAAEAPTGAEQPAPEIELEANRFAAALLMPGELVRRHYRACNGDFEELMTEFHCSGAAMGRRLHAVIERAPRGGSR